MHQVKEDLKLLRGTIKNFAELAVNNSVNNANISPFKIIILDEVDVMSHDAQFALRRIMEDYSKNTRFILICNEVTKIFPPLRSRCTRFRFLPIDIENSKKVVHKILEAEGYNDVEIEDTVFSYIYEYTAGDLRKTITMIQRLSYVADLYNLTIDDVRDVIGELPDILVNKIINLMKMQLNRDTQLCIYKISEEIINDGYDCLFLVNHLFHYFLNSTIDDYQKGLIISKLSAIDNRLCTASCEHIQIVDMLMYINGVCNKIYFDVLQNPFSIKVAQ